MGWKARDATGLRGDFCLNSERTGTDLWEKKQNLYKRKDQDTRKRGNDRRKRQ